MMLRRDFLRRLAMTAAGLLVADDALELLTEPRRFWPGAELRGSVNEVGYWPGRVLAIDEIDRLFKEQYILANIERVVTAQTGILRLMKARPGRPEGRRYTFPVRFS